MIKRRCAPCLFSFILSGMMSLIIAAVATMRASDVSAAFGSALLASWMAGWAIAFPTVMVVAPLTRRIVDRLTTDS